MAELLSAIGFVLIIGLLYFVFISDAGWLARYLRRVERPRQLDVRNGTAGPTFERRSPLTVEDVPAAVDPRFDAGAERLVPHVPGRNGTETHVKQ